MTPAQEKSLNSQATLVHALARRLSSALPPPNEARLIETHISWVLLAGDFAYKIKKAIKLDFLDFADLESRRFYCQEEIRLNRRLAPQIYLDVVAIGGAADAPELGELPALEWAVRMMRFDIDDEMDRRLKRGTLSAVHIDGLAALLARFHQSLEPGSQDASYGQAYGICHAARENLKELGELLQDENDRKVHDDLMSTTEKTCAALRASFARRRADGCVRECHGDLHLANIVLIGGEAVPFDGIEFDPALRWIDVVNDLAFPYMDLIRYDRPDLAHRLLTRYLEESGDYDGVETLPFYASGRAAVRAKVHALRAAQASTTPAGKQESLIACRAYLNVAARLLQPRRPGLIVTCGLPGSGKSTFALAAVERLGAIRVRSDVERKRLFGLKPLEAAVERLGAIRVRSDVERKRLFGLKPLEASQGDIYGADAGARTYDALQRIAGRLLAAGFAVVVDAAFLRQAERERFKQLAQDMGVPFAIAFLQSSDAVLQQRIAERMLTGGDPSEADHKVLAMLQSVAELPQPAEMAQTVEFANDGVHGFSVDAAAWGRLEGLLGQNHTATSIF